MNLENVLPMDIEKRSFEIITEELGELKLDPDKESIIKRCIHTAADFDYARTLRFSDNVVADTLAVMKNGGFTIVTDTKMAQTGINKAALAKERFLGAYTFADVKPQKEELIRGIL